MGNKFDAAALHGHGMSIAAFQEMHKHIFAELYWRVWFK